MMTPSNGNIFSVTGLLYGDSPVTGQFPAQRPVTRSFDVFFDERLNKRLSKQWWGWWFETPSDPLWGHCNAMMDIPAEAQVGAMHSAPCRLRAAIEAREGLVNHQWIVYGPLELLLFVYAFCSYVAPLVVPCIARKWSLPSKSRKWGELKIKKLGSHVCLSDNTYTIERMTQTT